MIRPVRQIDNGFYIPLASTGANLINAPIGLYVHDIMLLYSLVLPQSASTDPRVNDDATGFYPDSLSGQ